MSNESLPSKRALAHSDIVTISAREIMAFMLYRQDAAGKDCAWWVELTDEERQLFRRQADELLESLRGIGFRVTATPRDVERKIVPYVRGLATKPATLVYDPFE